MVLEPPLTPVGPRLVELLQDRPLPVAPSTGNRIRCGAFEVEAPVAFEDHVLARLLVPLNRIHKLLRRQGVVVPKSTLVRLIALATDLAWPIDNVHWRELKARKCVLTAGTGLKVQIEGLPKVWHAVLDVFNGNQTAVYKFALTKHGDEIAKLLTGFQGVMMGDAESRLNELCRQEGIKRANCNAHPRRDFRDAEAAQPVLAKKAGDFISKMYSIERRASAEGLVGPNLLARRQAETRPIVYAFRLWLEAQLVVTPPLLKSDPSARSFATTCVTTTASPGSSMTRTSRSTTTRASGPFRIMPASG